MFRIAIAQYDFPVGAVQANAQRLRTLREQAAAASADLLLSPELALSSS